MSMASLLHISLLLPFVLFALLLSFIGRANGTPLSAGNGVIHAIKPTCISLQGDITSCNVGINSVPPLVTLDGGYQWLTVEPTTTTESGSTLTTNEAVWTATQTSYLDIKPITTTVTNGAITVSTSTQYVSFITTTTAPAGAAPTALIAAVVIAPVLVVALQPVVDNASGKTAEAIGLEIVTILAKSGFVLTVDDATQLGAVILTAGLVAPVTAGAYLYKSFPLKPYLGNINITPNRPSKTTPSLLTSSPTTSPVKTVTAIGDRPYSDYQDYDFGLTASGPTPTSDDFATSTPSATAKCNQSNAGVDVVVFNALANKFCTGLDLSKSSSTTIEGNATGLQNTYGSSIFFNFSQTANTCALGCNASYAKIVTSCEFNSHTIYGAGSLQDSCGTFAMSISAAPPKTTATPCIKVTLDNCIYQYETLSAGQPCPTIPVLPASCTQTTSIPALLQPPPTPTPSPPTLQAQQCYGANDFGRHMDINGDQQSSDVHDFCSKYDRTFTSASAPIKANGQSIIGVEPYHYTVSWIDNCVTMATQQSMSQPLGPDNPTVNCISLLTEDWRNCNNGGAGGYRDAGCLRYNFAATQDQNQIP